MEAGEHARSVNVLNYVAKACILARRAGNPTVEREDDIVGAEERFQCSRHGGTMGRVCRHVLGEVRRRTQRHPGWIRFSRRVPVGIGSGDRLVGAPEPVVILGLEAGDHPVAARDVRHRQHARSPYKVEPVVHGEPEHAVVPLP